MTLHSSDVDEPLSDYCWACNQTAHALLGMWGVLALSAAGAPPAWAAGVVAAGWLAWEAVQRLRGKRREGARNWDLGLDLGFEWGGTLAGLFHVLGWPLLFLAASGLVIAALGIATALRRRFALR